MPDIHKLPPNIFRAHVGVPLTTIDQSTFHSRGSLGGETAGVQPRRFELQRVIVPGEHPMFRTGPARDIAAGRMNLPTAEKALGGGVNANDPASGHFIAKLLQAPTSYVAPGEDLRRVFNAQDVIASTSSRVSPLPLLALPRSIDLTNPRGHGKSPCDPWEIIQLVGLLRDDDYVTRERARKRLEDLVTICGEWVLKFLKVLLQHETDAEAAANIKELIEWPDCETVISVLDLMLEGLKTAFDAYDAADFVWKKTWIGGQPSADALVDAYNMVMDYLDDILSSGEMLARCFSPAILQVLQSIRDIDNLNAHQPSPSREIAAASMIAGMAASLKNLAK